MPATTHSLAVELSAVIVAVAGQGAELTPKVMVTPGLSLPSGPFETEHNTLEQGLRAWAEAQSGLKLGYVEQLYTFADKARTGAGRRIVSIGYLALTREAADGATGWYEHFPWEDRRQGEPQPVTELINSGLAEWKNSAPDSSVRRAREQRILVNFPEDPRDWNEELVLQRYELLWEAGLIEEARREFLKSPSPQPLSPPRGGEGLDLSDIENCSKQSAHCGAPRPLLRGRGGWGEGIIPGLAMSHDHRRILATGIARLRAKIKYRPVVFELMQDRFTLLQLQATVEALAGLKLHKQNFRRLVQSQGLVEETSGHSVTAKGRPAQLFAFRREVLRERAAAGTKLPRSG